MSTELPLYRQEKRETCALACLRMVLAAHGTHVAESMLEAQVPMVPGGTDIEDLQRLALRFGLAANNVLSAFRKPLQHAVIPVRISAHFVTFHDPRVAAIVRRSRARFERAHRFLRYITLVCSARKLDS